MEHGQPPLVILQLQPHLDEMDEAHEQDEAHEEHEQHQYSE
jgi:hypothetical protein